jgi:hypothetical protein
MPGKLSAPTGPPNAPTGRHRLKITIADQNGRLTAEILQVAVR